MGHVTGDGTVGKALSVLDQVAAFGRPVRFSELLAQSPFPKPTLYRFVQTLTNQQMLAYDPDRQTYTPGMRLVRLAHTAWEQSALAPVARPHVEALSQTVNETVHLAQLDHAQVLYVDKRSAGRPVQMFSEAGKIGPAYCTGIGKAMLAFSAIETVDEIIDQQSFHTFTANTLAGPDALRAELADIKSNGYGFDREEHEPGIICIAMPILSERGRVLGGLSITSTTERNNLAGLEAYVPVLRETTNKIARDVQTWNFPDTETKETTGI